MQQLIHYLNSQILQSRQGYLIIHRCNIVYVTTSMVGRGQELFVDKTYVQDLTNTQKQWLARRAKPIILQKGILYRMGQNNKSTCVTIDEAQRCYRSFMKDSVEDILQQTLLPRRFLMQGIGNPSYFMMFFNYASPVMHVKELKV